MAENKKQGWLAATLEILGFSRAVTPQQMKRQAELGAFLHDKMTKWTPFG